MLHEFDLWSGHLTSFVLLNWLVTIGSSVAFLTIYGRFRWLLIKPSIILLGIGHVLFQWPFTIYSGYYETWLPQPYAMFVLVHGYIVVGLAGSAMLFRKSAWRNWERLRCFADTRDRSTDDLVIATLACLCVIMAAVYFLYVPLDCTGLYALIMDPHSAPLARELSLKLLLDAVPRYSLSLLGSSVVPLLTAVVVTSLAHFRPGTALRWLGLSLLMFTTWLLADLNGAKGILVGLSCVAVCTILWRRGLNISVRQIPFLIAIVLLPAYGHSILFSYSLGDPEQSNFKTCFERVRIQKPELEKSLIDAFSRFSGPVEKEGDSELERRLRELQAVKLKAISERNKPAGTAEILYQNTKYVLELSWLIALHHLDNARRQGSTILIRAFVTPLEVGGWYVHHFQTNGSLGLGAISKLAGYLGLQPIDGPNLIGQSYGTKYYGFAASPSINAGAGYLFSYYAYFGNMALLLNLFLLFLLDIALWVYDRLHNQMLLPVVAAMILPTQKFLEADYSAVWLTHGFGVMLALGLACSVLCRSLRPQPGPVRA